MIEFKWERYKNRVPVIRDIDIDVLAEAVIEEYSPEMLEEVKPIDHMRFNEFYLGLKVRFQDIFYKDGEDIILGATSFNDDESIGIFDKENDCVSKIGLKRGTVVLDNILTGAYKETQQAFTGLHEAGHWIMHQSYFSRAAVKGNSNSELKAACRSKAIYGRGKIRLETSEDFLEHQANYFASAMAMPRKTVLGIAPEILGKYHIDFTDGKGLVLEPNVSSYRKQYEIVGRYAKLFKVSRPTAKIRLHKLGIIVDNLHNEFWDSINFDNKKYDYWF
jgi:Zn-dependent peptidase ImmA (M78 family)